MSRRGSVRIALGPISFAPRPRRAKPQRKTAPPAEAHGGYPDVGTWGVAAALDPSHLAGMALQARDETDTARPELRATQRETITVALLALALRHYAERVTRDERHPLGVQLVHAGLDAVDWDAIARKALR